MKFEKYGPWLVFVAAMLWASDAPFRVHLTKELPSTLIVLLEHAVDVLFILPVLWWKRADFKKLTRKEWLAVLVIGVGSSALASVAFTQAFSYVNPSVAIVLQKLQPLLAIGLAAALLKEVLPKQFWIWCVVALGGAYVLSFPKLIPQSFPGEVFNPNSIGIILALVAAALWAAGTVLGKLVLSRASFQTMTALRFMVAFMFLLVLNAWQGTLPLVTRLTYTDWLYVVIIAVTSGVVSLFLYYKGLSHTKASIATLAELGFPVAAVFINYKFLHATLAPSQLIGTGILLVSIYMLSRTGVVAIEKN